MHKLYELKENLIKELEGYAKSGKYSKEDIEVIKYMASAVDHLCNIIDGDEEYSGNMMYDGSMRSYYGPIMPGTTSYARGRGRNAKRDAMGRYSSGDIIDQLEDLMKEAPDERTRQEMQKFITKMESMM